MTIRSIALSMALAALAGCSSPSRRSTGGECTINSDCASPLVCRLTRCRRECATSRDCPNGLACVRDRDGIGACQLEAESRCSLPSDCPSPLVCQLGKCTNECATNADCTTGSACMEVAGTRACVPLRPGRACATASSCAVPLICAPDGQCRAACVEDRDCYAAQLCLPSSDGAGGEVGVCFDQCSEWRDCVGTARVACGFLQMSGRTRGVCFDPVDPPATPFDGGVSHPDGATDGANMFDGSSETATADTGTAVDAAGDANELVADASVLDGSILDGAADGGPGRDAEDDAVDGAAMDAGVDDGPTDDSPIDDGSVGDAAGGDTTESGASDDADPADGDLDGAADGALEAGMDAPPDVRVDVRDSGPPPVPLQASAIVTSRANACVLRQPAGAPRTEDGKLYCWGDNANAQLSIPPAMLANAARARMTASGVGSFASVALASTSACGMLPAGNAYCWGANAFGQLGRGTTSTMSAAPMLVERMDSSPMLFPIGSVLAAGGSHVYATTPTTATVGWGHNAFGQIGLVAPPNTVAYARALPSPTYDAVVVRVGGTHVCALDAASTVKCWGQGGNGELGPMATMPSVSPIVVSDGSMNLTARALDCRDHHCCAVPIDQITWGAVVCWGSYFVDTTTVLRSISGIEPAPLPGTIDPTMIVDITAGKHHDCILVADGSAHCWGNNRFGQLGSSTSVGLATPAFVAPTPVAGVGALAQISAGDFFSCGLTVALDGDETRHVYCWGSNQDGELGADVPPDAVPHPTPLLVLRDGP